MQIKTYSYTVAISTNGSITRPQAESIFADAGKVQSDINRDLKAGWSVLHINSVADEGIVTVVCVLNDGLNK